MISKDNACLIIFIRNPVPGKVKSRIAETMGIVNAFTIYHELLKVTHDTCLRMHDCSKLLYYSEEILTDDGWDNQIFEKRLQQGFDLGEKMMNAITENLKKYGSVVLIGSDCPYITMAILREAFDILENNDLVIGPAEDGGYYLIGAKASYPELFKNIDWGSNSVFNQTIEKALNLKVGLLEKLSDIDTETDYKRWKTVFE